MKVCFITAFFHPVVGGAETHVLEIAKELIKKGHEVEVFTSDLTRDGKIELPEEAYQGIKIRRFKTWFKMGDFASFFPGVFKGIKKSDADIFHVHAYRHPFNFIVNSTDKPCLLTPHWPNYPKGLRKWYADIMISLFDKFFGSYLLNKFDKLLMVSGNESEWFIKKFNIDKSKFELTPNCIPKNYLNLRNKTRFKKKYDIRNNEIMILSLSRLHKSKGLDQVIKVSKHFPDIKFFIAGEGEYKQELQNLISELNIKNVIFTGSLTEEDKLEAYAAADIFIHPSHFEAFGIVILEAMSQGCAVIASNKGGMPWVVDKAGLLFEDNDLDDLKIKLGLLVRDKKLRNNLSRLGRERARNFTWDKIANKIERVYKELLNDKSDRRGIL